MRSSVRTKGRPRSFQALPRDGIPDNINRACLRLAALRGRLGGDAGIPEALAVAVSLAGLFPLLIGYDARV